MITRPDGGTVRSLIRMTDLAGSSRVRRRSLRLLLLVIGAVAILVGAATAADQYLRLAPASDAHRAQLLAELTALAPPAGATPIDTTSSSKPGQSLAQARFRGRSSFVELKEHYGPILTQAGWSYVDDKSTGTVDLACYRRGEDSASVSRDRTASEFVVELSSGLHVCD